MEILYCRKAAEARGEAVDVSWLGACRRRLRYGAPSGVFGRDGALAKSGPRRPTNSTHVTREASAPPALVRSRRASNRSARQPSAREWAGPPFWKATRVEAKPDRPPRQAARPQPR